MFAGVVEVYNSSSRPNVIREYRFWGRTSTGEWQPMESEQFHETNQQTDEHDHSNVTPLVLAPYSGTGARVAALSRQFTSPAELRIRVEVEDLFGRTYRVEVTARA